MVPDGSAGPRIQLSARTSHSRARTLIAMGRHHDPHGVLGLARTPLGRWKSSLSAVPARRETHRTSKPPVPMHARHADSRFLRVWQGPARNSLPARVYNLLLPLIGTGSGVSHECVRPLLFSAAASMTPNSPAFNGRASLSPGAPHPGRPRPGTVDGVAGVRFAVWAPHAERVSVVGPFNHWDGRRATRCGCAATSGVWELFIPGLAAAAELYKYELRNRRYRATRLKSDPYGARSRSPARHAVDRYARPINRSRLARRRAGWTGARIPGLAARADVASTKCTWAPGATPPDGSYLSYRRTRRPTRCLRPVELGFTHVEFLPITEHPLDDSWGYQARATSRPPSRSRHAGRAARPSSTAATRRASA